MVLKEAISAHYINLFLKYSCLTAKLWVKTTLPMILQINLHQSENQKQISLKELFSVNLTILFKSLLHCF